MHWLLVLSGLCMTGIWVDLKAEQRPPELKAGQSILVVNKNLTATGWNPAPEGEVHSFEQAVKLGIFPGSRTVDKRKIREIHSQLIRGLALIEGSCPPSHLNPGGHHFAHYGEYTQTHGLLRIFWMFYFERSVCM